YPGWSGSGVSRTTMAWESDSRRRAELPPNWEAIRREILDRDGRQCRWILPSGKRCPRRATDVDHFGDRNDHSPRNLRALCTHHHAKVTAMQGVRARRKKPRRRPEERHPGRLDS